MSEIDPTFISRRNMLFMTAGVGFAALTGCGESSQTTPPPNETEPTQSATPSPSLSPTTPEATQTPENTAVTESRLASNNEVARGLGALEKIAGRSIFTGAMEFFNVAADANERTEALSWQPAALEELAEAGLPNPYVILEPGMPVNDIEPGVLNSYFSSLRKAGAGTQPLRAVAMPEFIQGDWGGNDAEYYGQATNRTLRSLKRYLPKAEGTILIDTHPDEMDVILPAITSGVEKLDTSLIDSVGVQAYANAAPIPFDAQGKADISRYLSVDHIAQIAKATKQDHVWINTGIHKQDADLNIKYTPAQRIAIANATADVVEQAQQAGFTVDGLVLFAENKMAPPPGETEAEGRDYSFNASDIKALTTLADRLGELNVPLSGFAVKS